MDIDFIISSIPIQEQLSVPVIVVNAILGETDIRKIEKFIVNPKQNLMLFFKRSLCF